MSLTGQLNSRWTTDRFVTRPPSRTVWYITEAIYSTRAAQSALTMTGKRTHADESRLHGLLSRLVWERDSLVLAVC